MKKITILLLITYSINCFSGNISKDLIGTWICTTQNNLVYKFDTNKQYSYKFNDRFEITGQYKIDLKNNQLYLYFKNSKTPVKYSFKVAGDYLILMIHKKIENHIDEIILLKRQGSLQTLKLDSPTIKFLIPDGYSGYVYVNYNQSKNHNEYNNQNNILIEIHKSGKTITQNNINPYSYITKNIEFKYESNLNTIPFFIFNEYTGRLNNLLNQGFSMDSTYVCLYGFNQIARENINKIFDQEIKGNVLMFKIDSLKNLIHNPYTNVHLDK